MISESLDLNFIKIFVAVYREKNVSRAAENLGMSQSSLSHAIRKLREQLDDPLFVKSGHGVIPTSRADFLAKPFEDALDIIHDSIAQSAHFECRYQERVFVIATSDFGEFAILPELMKWLTEVSPNVRVKVVPADVVILEKQLFEGEVDIAIGYLPMINEKFRSQRLLKVDWITVLRRGHPLLEEEKTLENFSKYPQASFTLRTGKKFTDEDVTLKLQGLFRKAVLEVPSFMTLPHIVSRSNIITTVPRQMINYLSHHQEIVLLEPPVPLEGVHMNQYWHERLHNDPSHTWFRNVLFELCQRL